MSSVPGRKFRKMQQEVHGSVADDVMCGTVELCLQVYDSKRDTEKVDRVASPS